MSSNAYAAEITPDPRLRRFVVASGAALAVAGCMATATLPLGAAWRICLGAAWCASVWRELWLLCRAWRGCRGVSIRADGDVAVLGPGGERAPARLVPGSVLLPRLGWLRLQVAGSPAFAELVRGDRRTDRDWRRLHVIWRHFGAAQ